MPRPDVVLAWIAIGLGASLATMIWPFRRGALGVILNAALGVAGALAAALLGYVCLPRPRHDFAPAHLFFAALGALATLGIAHAAWARRVERRRSAE